MVGYIFIPASILSSSYEAKEDTFYIKLNHSSSSPSLTGKTCWPNARGGDLLGVLTVLKACVACFPNPALGTAARDTDGGVDGSGADCRLDWELGEVDSEPGSDPAAEGVGALRDARACAAALGGE